MATETDTEPGSGKLDLGDAAACRKLGRVAEPRNDPVKIEGERTDRRWFVLSLSGGVGLTRWSIVPDGAAPLPIDEERRKTVNYGGGARWFARKHLAFSLDVRFYEIAAGIGQFALPASPRTKLLVIGAGISVR